MELGTDQGGHAVTLNFRIPAKKVVTYAGPEFLGCFGSARPVISCFKRPGWLVGNKNSAAVRVWFVAMAVPEMLDNDTRRTYDKILIKTGYRKLRSFGKGHHKVRVFYSRTSAVDAFNALVETRKAENATARAERVAARAEVANATTLADATAAVIKNFDHFA